MLVKRLRVGPFVRVSSMGQVFAESPETHIEGAEEWCERNNADIVTWFRLDSISGSESLNHSEAKRMVYMAKTGQIDAVLFTSLTRFGRDMIELVKMHRELEKHGVRMISIQENIDTSTVSGLDQFYNLARAAEIEIKRLSERVRRGNAMRRRRGEIVSREPYGYRKENKRLVIDEEQGPVRQRMYHLYLEHKRIKTVTEILNSEKIPPPSAAYSDDQNAKWTANTVRRLLRNKTAVGIYISNRYYGRNNKNTKPEDQWVEQPCPPLVSKEVFDRVQKLLDKNKENQPDQKPRTAYSGLLHCCCGTRMRYKKDNPKIHFYARYHCPDCHKSIRATEIDQLIGSMMMGFKFDDLPDSAEWQPTEDMRWERLEGIKKQIVSIEKERNNLIALVTQSSSFSPQDFDARHQPLVERQKALESEQQALESELALHKESEDEQELLKDILSKLQWKDLLNDEKSAVLRSFVEGIKIHPTKILVSPRVSAQRVFLAAYLPLWGFSDG